MKKLLIIFLAVLIAFDAIPQEKRLALVIGNSNYTYGGTLANPVNDANIMATTLQDLGFAVIKKTNATKEQMDDAILDFWRRLENCDVALFYYAGHGIQLDGINYLLPIDAELYDRFAVEIEAVDVGKVVKKFEYYPDNINIVILDACRDNPFRSWVRGGMRGFVAMNAPSGTIIAFATSAGATADDGAGSNGLYTEKLVQQMRIEQRIEDVFINTRVAVQKASGGNQSPQEWSQLTGKFFFKKGDFTNIAIEPETGQFINNNITDIDVLRFDVNNKTPILNGKVISYKETKNYLMGQDIEAFKIYKRQHTILATGLILFSTGLIGGGFSGLEIMTNPPPSEALVIVASSGGIVFVVGLSVTAYIDSRQKKWMKSYNLDNFSNIEIGPTENGFGIVYNF